MHDLQDVLPDNLINTADYLGKSDSTSPKKLPNEWNNVTGSYFKSVASMLVLHQIFPHKDIGCEEVRFGINYFSISKHIFNLFSFVKVWKFLILSVLFLLMLVARSRRWTG